MSLAWDGFSVPPVGGVLTPSPRGPYEQVPQCGPCSLTEMKQLTVRINIIGNMLLYRVRSPGCYGLTRVNLKICINFVDPNEILPIVMVKETFIINWVFLF